jgi:hypothetical protein
LNFRVSIQEMTHPQKMAFLIVLVTKILILTIGYITTYINNGPASPLSVFENLFNRWDAPNYVDIAQNGYTNIGDQANFIVFFPLYPFLIQAITLDFTYGNISALIISNLSSLIAFLYLYKLAKLEFNEGVAVRTVLFLSVFPTAYFLSVPYTEGLFFALAIASIYYARKKQWELAGTLGFFTSITRLAGLLLLPVLLVEYYHQKVWKLKKTDAHLTGVFMPVGGFLIYLWINLLSTGNAFTFMGIEANHWFNRLDPWSGLQGAYYWATTAEFSSNLTIGIAPIAFAVFGLLITGIAIWRRFRPSLIMCMFLSWGLAVSTSWWISVPRYIMAMFPLYIVMGLLIKRKLLIGATLIVSSIILCFFTVLFALGWWAF